MSLIDEVLLPGAADKVEFGPAPPSSAARPGRRALVRAAVLLLAGAAPVSAIPLYVLGWLPMTDAALFGVIPLALIAAVLMVRRSPQAGWAARGVLAGLVAVLAYDAVRMPLVWTGVWPDFIPRLGGWITGSTSSDAFVGYTWRYLGDGAGIGLSFFVVCGVMLSVRPALVTARPVRLGVGYGVLVWTGLLATVVLPARGEELLFRLTPASFMLSLLGHVVYGATLGLFLRGHLRTTMPRTVRDGRSSDARQEAFGGV
jgi:hypothetical protein